MRLAVSSCVRAVECWISGFVYPCLPPRSELQLEIGEGGNPPKTKRITGKKTLMVIVLIKVHFQIMIRNTCFQFFGKMLEYNG